MKEIRSLTGIRGLAAVWVMAFHIQLALPLPWLRGARIAERGWAGVDLFFVLSGFILMYAHGSDFVAIGRPALVRFTKLRFGRIYPLNLAVLLIIALIVAADGDFARDYAALSPGNLSAGAFLRTALLATRWFLPGKGDWNQPTWSLSVEILGYAAFPLLAFGLMRCRSAGLASGLGLASLAALALYQVATGTWGQNVFDQTDATIRMACCFAAGAALSRARMLAPELARHAGRLAAGALLLTFAAIATHRLALFMQLGFCSLILALSFERGPINALLASPPILFLGRISFPLYLFHAMPLFWLYFRTFGHPMAPVAAIGIVVSYVAFCLSCATLLHRFVERPCHRIAKAWARHDARPAEAVASG